MFELFEWWGGCEEEFARRVCGQLEVVFVSHSVELFLKGFVEEVVYVDEKDLSFGEFNFF